MILLILFLFNSNPKPLLSEKGESWIVFASFRGGDFASSLHRIKLDGSQETAISRHSGGKPNSLDPSVCPDGRILFTRGDGSHLESVWIMDGDGGSEKLLVEGVGRRFPGGHALPSLSPDGKTLLYVHANGKKQTLIQTRALDGGEEKSLGPGRYPSWSRDGKIAFIRDVEGVDQLFVLDKGKARQLTFGKGCAFTTWSPDGKYLAFSGVEGKHLDLFVIPVNGGKARNITQTQGIHEKEPSWSPDGKLIAFTRPAPDAPDGWQKSIYLISSDGGETQRVSDPRYNDTHPSWLVVR